MSYEYTCRYCKADVFSWDLHSCPGKEAKRKSAPKKEVPVRNYCNRCFSIAPNKIGEHWFCDGHAFSQAREALQLMTAKYSALEADAAKLRSKLSKALEALALAGGEI